MQEKLEADYIQQLKTMEHQIIKDNKKFVLQREIMGFVDPQDIIDK